MLATIALWEQGDGHSVAMIDLVVFGNHHARCMPCVRQVTRLQGCHALGWQLSSAHWKIGHRLPAAISSKLKLVTSWWIMFLSRFASCRPKLVCFTGNTIFLPDGSPDWTRNWYTKPANYHSRGHGQSKKTGAHLYATQNWALLLTPLWNLNPGLEG